MTPGTGEILATFGADDRLRRRTMVMQAISVRSGSEQLKVTFQNLSVLRVFGQH